MRNEIIRLINDVIDENTDLKIRNAFLEAEEKRRTEICCSEKNEMTALDYKINEYGRKKLAEDILKAYGNQVYVSRDEDTKELKFTTYDAWVKNKIYSNYIPTNMSQEEVENAIESYARKLYEKEKSESLKRFEEKEKEDSDE